MHDIRYCTVLYECCQILSADGITGPSTLSFTLYKYSKASTQQYGTVDTYCRYYYRQRRPAKTDWMGRSGAFPAVLIQISTYRVLFLKTIAAFKVLHESRRGNEGYPKCDFLVEKYPRGNILGLHSGEVAGARYYIGY